MPFAHPVVTVVDGSADSRKRRVELDVRMAACDQGLYVVGISVKARASSTSLSGKPADLGVSLRASCREASQASLAQARTGIRVGYQ
jgi:hypothetical protein